jgi:hypothetical protein
MEHSLAFWQEFIAFMRRKAGEGNLGLPGEFRTLPGFIHEIVLNQFRQEELPPLLKTEYELLNAYYACCAGSPNRFLRAWSNYNRDLRNILIAINGRHHKIDYAPWLISANDLTEQLRRSNAADFGLGKEHELFENLLRIWEQNNILYRERGYDILRWKWIEAQNFFQYFNIDRVLGYWCKLSILDRWVNLDPGLGKDLFQDTLDSLENSFTFPQHFNIKSKK